MEGENRNRFRGETKRFSREARRCAGLSCLSRSSSQTNEINQINQIDQIDQMKQISTMRSEGSLAHSICLATDVGSSYWPEYRLTAVSGGA